MNKILVEVFVPVLNRQFDIFIPLQPPMYQVLDLMKKAVTELSGGRFSANEGTVLCYREEGTILNINLSVYELGLRNGSKLMLI